MINRRYFRFLLFIGIIITILLSNPSCSHLISLQVSNAIKQVKFEPVKISLKDCLACRFVFVFLSLSLLSTPSFTSQRMYLAAVLVSVFSKWLMILLHCRGKKYFTLKDCVSYGDAVDNVKVQLLFGIIIYLSGNAVDASHQQRQLCWRSKVWMSF